MINIKDGKIDNSSMTMKLAGKLDIDIAGMSTEVELNQTQESKLQSFDAAGAHFGQPGYETNLLYLAGLVALCFGGPGQLSIDGLLNRFKRFGAAEA